MSIPIVRPLREPDFIDAKGGYYWFNELLYLSGTTSRWVELDYHPDVDRLVVKNYECKTSWCECTDDASCPNRFINPVAEAKRKEQAIAAFEEAVFGPTE